jgi:magnesium transporter
MTITTRCYRDGRALETGFDPDRVSDALADPRNLLWVDVDEPTSDDIELLGKEFGFHQLALEDSEHPHQRAKIEQYDTYFFVVAYGASLRDDELEAHELAMFVSRNYLVTVRKPPAYDISGAVARWEGHGELASEGGGYLLYILLDEIVDGYFDVLERGQERADDIENLVFGPDDPERTQGEIFRLKKDLMRFRRAVAPLREVLDVLQRQRIDVVTVTLEPYYRDVYDHVLRAIDFIDSLRDLLTSALEASLAVVSNRLNEVMKRLTSWAAIILVPTLIAGIYGMNFDHMPELHWYLGYPAALGLMALSGALLHRMFRRRGWL